MPGSAEEAQWLPGARFNIAESALRGDDSRPAVLWADEAAPATVRTLSLGQLRRQALAVAASLRASGYTSGGCSCRITSRIGLDSLLPLTAK